jgi:hypothetical protein
MSIRATHFDAREARRLVPTRRWAVVAAMTAITFAWAGVIVTATRVHPSATVHQLALFGHLAALVVGFGAVLTVDWFGLLWTLRRRPLVAVLDTAHGAHFLIWLGLLGLSISGALLSPNLASPLTDVKLVAVLTVAINGIHVGRLQTVMASYVDGRTPPRSLVLGGALAVLVSQAAWWTATTIGFLTASRHPL